MIQEKHHRLDPALYRGYLVVSFTACMRNRATFFTNPDRFIACEHLLLEELHHFHCDAEVYLFMPDHAHLLLRGASDASDILRVMKSFKQRSGFWLSQKHPQVHWQKDYFDHILRDSEDVEQHIRYILNNPVRKERVESWKDYPFKGSTIHKLDGWDP